MTRSGYSDDCGGIALINWRGAVESAIRGKRGQAFLREMLTALDALPQKRLIAEDIVSPAGECCAIGSVALKRGMDVREIEPTDREYVAEAFGIAPALAAEIAYVNDEEQTYDYAAHRWAQETPEQRFTRVRAWVVKQIKLELSP